MTGRAALLALLSLLLACDKPQPAPPPAPPPVAVPAAAPAIRVPAAQLTEQLLLQAVFGNAAKAGGDYAYAPLADPDDPAAAKSPYLITYVAHSVLKNGDVVLVANAEPGNEAGASEAGQGNGGLLNLFFLRLNDGRWQVRKRLENIASLGTRGQLGNAQFIELGADKPGLAVLSSTIWDGYTLLALSLFDLTQERPHALTSLLIESDNAGRCHPDLDGRPCWNVKSQWRLEAPASPGPYHELVLDFTGEETVGKGAPTPVAGSARYRHDGKQYALAEGRHLVPRP